MSQYRVTTRIPVAVLSALACVVLAAYYRAAAAEGADAALETVLRGMEFNESLVTSTEGWLSSVSTQSEEAREWLRGWNEQRNAGGEGPRLGVFPPGERRRVSRWAAAGVRCRLEQESAGPAGTSDAEPVALEVMLYDGEKHTGYSPARESAYIHDRREELGACAPLATLGLIEAPGIPLSRWLRQGEATLLGTRELEGAACYVLQLVDVDEDTARVEVWIDPSVGYRPRLIARFWPDGGLSSRRLFSAFDKHADGVWLPHKMTSESFLSRQRHGASLAVTTTATTLDHIAVNATVPASRLALELPVGTHVFDARTETAYTVEGDPPADETVLKAARLAAGLLSGDVGWETIEKELPGETRRSTDGETVGRGVSRQGQAGVYSVLLACGLLDVEATSQELADLVPLDSLDAMLDACEAKHLPAERATAPLSELQNLPCIAIARLHPEGYGVIVGFRDDRCVLIEPPAMVMCVPNSLIAPRWTQDAILLRRQ